MNGSSCEPRLHELGGTRRPVEAYGAEAWWSEPGSFRPQSDCHDCGAPLGGFHHFGCDMEICPHDGTQAMLCECEVVPA